MKIVQISIDSNRIIWTTKNYEIQVSVVKNQEENEIEWCARHKPTKESETGFHYEEGRLSMWFTRLYEDNHKNGEDSSEYE